MGGDTQFDNTTKIINTGGFDKVAVLNRQQNFSKTVVAHLAQPII